ncbi:HD domain-containing protein [Bifidobacterium sp. UBA6881]|uniref:HD domain-containing protein n=1 Tax=Bifidobacterium sp. UBA6881 TaxID=1946109 RepID=UPI000EE4AAB1|nr:HD domain-containing protein [Bifidobacterium sp. UBA6881]HAH53422.1 phosphohydrolase [Bifidobacterium sp.]
MTNETKEPTPDQPAEQSSVASPASAAHDAHGYIPTLNQVEELHRKIAQSQAAYDLIHGHCVVVADIARRMARRQNALFTRRCTLPADAPEQTGDFGLDLSHDESGAETFGMLRIPAVQSTDGITGGSVPPRLIDEHMVVIGALLHDIGTYFLLKQDGSDGNPLKFDGPRYVQHGLKGYEYLLKEGVDESIAQFARNHTGVGLTKQAVESQGLPLPPADYVPMNLEQEVVMVADKYNSKSIPPKFLTAEAYTRKAARFGENNKREWLRLLERYGIVDVKPLAEQYHMRIAE